MSSELTKDYMNSADNLYNFAIYKKKARKLYLFILNAVKIYSETTLRTIQ